MERRREYNCKEEEFLKDSRGRKITAGREREGRWKKGGSEEE